MELDLSRQLIPHSVRISFISVIRAIRGQFQYDEVGTRLEARRCDLDLDGWFNNLSQLTHLTCGGQLNIIGSVSTSNAYVLVQGKTNEPPFYPNPGTNWLGAATVSAGSNSIPIVAWEGTNSSRANLTVYMPPSNPQIFTYDLNGSLTAEGQRTYQWTEENRLKEIETSAAATAIGIPKRKSVYTYDGMGRRIGKTDLANWSDGAYCTTNVQTFIYDGWLLVREQSASGGNVTTNQYIWGLDLSQSLQGAGGIGGLLCVIRNGERYFPVFDGNGNISDYLDQTGAVVAHYEYSPFGRLVVATGAMKDVFSFRFSTKYYEPFWKPYYYGLRYYSPEISRWLSRDPIGEKGFHEQRTIARLFPIVGGQELIFSGQLQLGFGSSSNLPLGKRRCGSPGNDHLPSWASTARSKTVVVRRTSYGVETLTDLHGTPMHRVFASMEEAKERLTLEYRRTERSSPESIQGNAYETFRGNPLFYVDPLGLDLCALMCSSSGGLVCVDTGCAQAGGPAMTGCQNITQYNLLCVCAGTIQISI